MKTSLSFLALSFILSSSVFARIVEDNKQLYVETSSGKAPITMLNNMIKSKTVTKLKTYDNGKVHLISFSKHNGPTKLYSVDEKGYIYSIEPFTNYSVSNIEDNGKFQFREIPNRKFVVDAKGYFLY